MLGYLVGLSLTPRVVKSREPFLTAANQRDAAREGLGPA